MSRIKAVIGMRVKVIQGDDERLSFSHPEVPITHACWIAGRIPIGTVGTIREIPQNEHQKRMGFKPMLAIDFGPEFPARQGYAYGILDMIESDKFEVLD